MKSTLIIFTLLFCKLFCFGQVQSGDIELTEDYYITVKNSLVHKINSNINYDDPNLYVKNDLYLDSLNALLKLVLRDNPLQRTFAQSRISLETLIPEVGYDKLDALQVMGDAFTLSYTTKKLLDNYSGRFYDYNDLNTIDLGEIVHSFSSDAAVLGVYSTELATVPNIEHVYFVVALESQDPNYLQNKTVYAIWNIQNHIYVLRTDQVDLELKECDSLWNGIALDKKKKGEAFKSENPGLTGSEYRRHEIRLEKEAFVDYGTCYQSDTNQLVLNEAKREITELIQQILMENNRNR